MSIWYRWKPRTTLTELDDTPEEYTEGDLAVRVKTDLTGVEFASEYYVEYDTYADLPAAADHAGKVYLVLTSTGVPFVNWKRKGLWHSDGADWARLGNVPSRSDMGLATTDSPIFAAIRINDANTELTEDGSHNMTLKDAVTGTKTLAELAAAVDESDEELILATQVFG